MSRFTSHLGLTPYERRDGTPILRGDRVQWFLTEPLSYDVGDEASGETITVPAFLPWGKADEEIVALLMKGDAFLTDLASIPWPARGLLPPDGPWVKAAVIHDRLYATKGMNCGVRLTSAGEGSPVSYSRKSADDILAQAMKVLGVPAFKRGLIHSAVRAFGGRGWGT